MWIYLFQQEHKQAPTSDLFRGRLFGAVSVDQWDCFQTLVWAVLFGWWWIDFGLTQMSSYGKSAVRSECGITRSFYENNGTFSMPLITKFSSWGSSKFRTHICVIICQITLPGEGKSCLVRITPSQSGFVPIISQLIRFRGSHTDWFRLRIGHCEVKNPKWGVPPLYPAYHSSIQQAIGYSSFFP